MDSIYKLLLSTSRRARIGNYVVTVIRRLNRVSYKQFGLMRFNERIAVDKLRWWWPALSIFSRRRTRSKRTKGHYCAQGRVFGPQKPRHVALGCCWCRSCPADPAPYRRSCVTGAYETRFRYIPLYHPVVVTERSLDDNYYGSVPPYKYTQQHNPISTSLHLGNDFWYPGGDGGTHFLTRTFQPRQPPMCLASRKCDCFLHAFHII